MQRPRPHALSALLCALLLAGCGSTIGRIDGLPETRDTSAVPWPRLVDTPAPPVGLRPEKGAATLVTLNRSRDTVLTRAAQPGPERVALAELGERVVRIRQQASSDGVGVDEADLAARAARLAQVRAAPVSGVSASELAARAQRIAAARTPVIGVDANDLQARAQRIAAARASGTGGIGASELQVRAQRVTAARGVAPSGTYQDALRERGNRVLAQTQSESTIMNRDDLTTRTQRRGTAAPPPAVVSAPGPRPKPAIPPKGREEPVITDTFRKRAEEARRRALERSEAEKAE